MYLLDNQSKKTLRLCVSARDTLFWALPPKGFRDKPPEAPPCASPPPIIGTSAGRTSGSSASLCAEDKNKDHQTAHRRKKKLDVDFRPYKILGACNPPFAYQALQAEDKIGTMLPCNVIVQELEHGIEVAAVDPAASMQAVGNEGLSVIAEEVRSKLRKAIDRL